MKVYIDDPYSRVNILQKHGINMVNIRRINISFSVTLSLIK